jgi:amino acid transporter
MSQPIDQGSSVPPPLDAVPLPQFPKSSHIVLDQQVPLVLHPLDSAPTHQLGQLPATAICGNDITSSCLYVAALSLIYAGKYAPFALLMVAGLLYLFRWIYAEVGDALPLNGGAYNCLLNTTSKYRASLAACMTILSYIATAVISAGEAMHYAKNLVPAIDPFTATIVLLGFFALLTIIGITESAVVATAIFLFHMVTLVVFCLIGGWYVFSNPSVLSANWAAPSEHDLWKALFFGFAAALLGISGFESSANFIEEQKDGVFVKTLRNMWASVSIFNPVIGFLVLGILPLAAVRGHTEDLLAHSGGLIAGPWLRTWVSLDATLVLSGAVLTSFVGVTGLIKRLTLDRCLPQALLKENKLRGTSHRIIIAFFVLCVSINVVTGGHIETLAGVYTISFLGVMALFAIGNMLLKVNRRDLPRRYRAGWPTVLIALIGVLIGIAGNIVLNPGYLLVFFTYFIPTATLISIMLWRTNLLKILLFVLRSTADTLNSYNRRISRRVIGKIDDINAQGIVFFTRGDSRRNLNEVMLYVRNNEQTKRLKVVHVYRDEKDIPPRLAHDLSFLDEVYTEIGIEFVTVKGQFGPDLIERLSVLWDIPKNYMFIGSPTGRLPFRLSDLGGVRLIV